MVTAKTLIADKLGAGLKRDFQTRPKGTMARFAIMAGLIFTAYTVIVWNGDFGMATNHIINTLTNLKG